MKQIFLIYHQTIASTWYKNTIILRVSNALSGLYKLLAFAQTVLPYIKREKLRSHFHSTLKVCLRHSIFGDNRNLFCLAAIKKEWCKHHSMSWMLLKIGYSWTGQNVFYSVLSSSVESWTLTCSSKYPLSCIVNKLYL